jgi:hypothetical protein
MPTLLRARFRLKEEEDTDGTREETHDDDETETDRVVRGVRDEETDRVVRVVGAWERCVCMRGCRQFVE